MIRNIYTNENKELYKKAFTKLKDNIKDIEAIWFSQLSKGYHMAHILTNRVMSEEDNEKVFKFYENMYKENPEIEITVDFRNTQAIINFGVSFSDKDLVVVADNKDVSKYNSLVNNGCAVIGISSN